MTTNKMLEKINKIREQLIEKNEWEYIGVRFENKEREIGEICECSKDNPDREDERDYPEYGTPEYDELPEREGTCAWDLRDEFRIDSFWLDKSVEVAYPEQKHCYIVVGDNVQNTWNDNVDEDEIIIINAKVVAKIF